MFTVGREAVADALPSGIKLKDFRTLAATTHAEALLARNPPQLTGDDRKDARQVIGILKAASNAVAEKLNNTPAVARRSYIAPQVVQAWGREHGIKEEWLK